MKRALYVSQSQIPANRDTFRQTVSRIMVQSQFNNRSENITGVLAYDRGRFFQFIEGPEQAIDALVGRLLGDERHANMTIRLDEPVEERLFPKWSMALLNMTAPPLAGYATGDLEDLSANQIIDRLQRAAEEEAILAVAPSSQISQ